MQPRTRYPAYDIATAQQDIYAVKLLALEKNIPTPRGDDYHDLLRGEALRVWDLVQKDIIRQIFFREDTRTAVLILECEDENEAADILEALPLARAGLIEFDVIPLVPYSGFARLFAITED